MSKEVTCKNNFVNWSYVDIVFTACSVDLKWPEYYRGEETENKEVQLMNSNDKNSEKKLTHLKGVFQHTV